MVDENKRQEREQTERTRKVLAATQDYFKCRRSRAGRQRRKSTREDANLFEERAL